MSPTLGPDRPACLSAVPVLSRRGPDAWASGAKRAREGHLPGCGELQRPRCEALPLPAPGPACGRARSSGRRARPRLRPTLGAGGGAGISGPLPQSSPRPARGSEDPWTRGWRRSFVPAVSGLGGLGLAGRGLHGTAAGRGAGAQLGCIPAGPGCGAWAQCCGGSLGLVPGSRPRACGQCPRGG